MGEREISDIGKIEVLKNINIDKAGYIDFRMARGCMCLIGWQIMVEKE